MHKYIAVNGNSGEIIETYDFKLLFNLVRMNARYKTETSEMWVFFGSKCKPICTIHSATTSKPMRIIKNSIYPMLFQEGYIAFGSAKALFDIATDSYR